MRPRVAQPAQVAFMTSFRPVRPWLAEKQQTEHVHERNRTELGLTHEPFAIARQARPKLCRTVRCNCASTKMAATRPQHPTPSAPLRPASHAPARALMAEHDAEHDANATLPSAPSSGHDVGGCSETSEGQLSRRPERRETPMQQPPCRAAAARSHGCDHEKAMNSGRMFMYQWLNVPSQHTEHRGTMTADSEMLAPRVDP